MENIIKKATRGWEEGKIGFVEIYTGTWIPYNKVHKTNPFRWKDLYKTSSLRLSYKGEEEGEAYELFQEFIELVEWYAKQN